MALDDMSTKPIGVFDSGIGGLTVLKELLARLPHETFVYFGDTARVPYGNKSADTIRRFSSENVKLLLERDVKMVVVACNTATATRFRGSSRTNSSCPSLASSNPACARPSPRRTTAASRVIGTSGTIRSMAYQNAILAVKPEARVVSKACPLCPCRRRLDRHAGHAPRCRGVLKPLAGIDIDTLVLGCTHYPLFKPVIGGRGGVTSGGLRCRDLARSPSYSNSRSSRRRVPGRFDIILSENHQSDLAEIASRFLGGALPEIELVSVR
jgi:glutamate racemase